MEDPIVEQETGPSCAAVLPDIMSMETGEEMYDTRLFQFVKKKLGAKSYYLATPEEKRVENLLHQKRVWDKKFAEWMGKLSNEERKYMQWRKNLGEIQPGLDASFPPPPPRNKILHVEEDFVNREVESMYKDVESMFQKASNQYRELPRDRKKGTIPPPKIDSSIKNIPRLRYAEPRITDTGGDPGKVFVYKYINRKDFIAEVEHALVSGPGRPNRIFRGAPFISGLTRGKEKDAKQVVPPIFTPEDVDYVKQLYENPEVDFILFPMQLYGKFHMWCAPEVFLDPTKKGIYRPTNTGIHNIVLLYNKRTQQIEIIDDDYGLHQKYFNYEDFVAHDLYPYMREYLDQIFHPTPRGPSLLPKYIIPSTNPSEKKGVNTAVHLPIIREDRYGHAFRILQDFSFPNDFSIIYKAFLGNYLHLRKHLDPRIRSENLEKDESIIPLLIDVNIQKIYEELQRRLGVTRVMKKVPIETDLIYDFLESYTELRIAKGEDIYKTNYIPTDVSETTRGAILSPCPPGYYRILGKDCVKDETYERYDQLLKLSHYYLDYGKHFYPEDLSKWFTLIMRYFADEYPNVGVFVPNDTYGAHPFYYAIRYYRKTNKKSGQSSMDVQLSPDLLKFLREALNDPSYSVILVMINIRRPKYAHANLLVITKSTSPDKPHEVHRVEVNAPFYHEHGRNKEDIDKDIETYFKRELSDYTFKFTNALSICPVAGHSLEFSEPTWNIKDRGGRCAEWAIFYMELIAANPLIPYPVLYTLIAERIVRSGSAKHFIYGYTARLVEKARLYKIKGYNKIMKQKRRRATRTPAAVRADPAVLPDILYGAPVPPPVIPIETPVPKIVVPSLDEQLEEEREVRAILGELYGEIEKRGIVEQPSNVGDKRRRAEGGKKKSVLL